MCIAQEGVNIYARSFVYVRMSRQGRNRRPDHPPAGDYPAELATTWPLVYGRSITVRPIRADDADIERLFLDGLSPETRYHRFLGGGITVTPEWLARLTDIDYRTHMAFVATTLTGGAEEMIAVARYIRLAEDEASAEYAITVADAWQGHGIGRRLMTMLIAHARRAGVGRLVGEILGSNIGMLHMMHSLGFEVHHHPDAHELRLATLDLASEAPSASNDRAFAG